MIHIADNFFEDQICKEIANQLYLNSHLNSKFRYDEKNLKLCIESNEFQDICIAYTNRFFSLESMIGYEMWYNIDQKPQTWHIDKDEMLYAKYKKVSYPFCSIIYYPHIALIQGGNFLYKINVNDDAIYSVEPKTNRLIIVPPGISHNVEAFAGKRCSIVICPWSYKIERFF